MNYTQELTATIKEKQQIIHNNLNRKGIFPSKSSPFEPLDETAELLLKMTYSLKVGFLEEFSFIFAFVLSKSSLESLVLNLESNGYIKSQTSKDFGKYWVLSKPSLLCITANPKSGKAVPIVDDNFPSKERLCLYKTINGHISQLIFGTMTNMVVNRFKEQSKEERQLYNRSFYIRQYLYTAQKKGVYSKTDAQAFVQSVLPTFENDTEEYERYLAFLRSLKSSKDALVWFSFLKEFFNSLGFSKSTVLSKTAELFYSYTTNLYREQYYTYRQKLYDLYPSKSLRAESNLFLIDNLFQTLTITRRNMLNSNMETKTTEELATLKQDISNLDEELRLLKQRQAVRSDVFLLMTFSHYDKHDIPVFTEKQLSFESLRKNNVFLLNAKQRGEGQKPLLEFGIFPNSSEELTTSFLFNRLEALLLFAYHHLTVFEISIQIFIYDDSQLESTKNRLHTVQEEFENISSQYATFIDLIETIPIRATKRHFKERFEVFRDLKF